MEFWIYWLPDLCYKTCNYYNSDVFQLILYYEPNFIDKYIFSVNYYSYGHFLLIQHLYIISINLSKM